MSDYDFNERLEAEERLFQALGGLPRLTEILKRLLAPIAGIRKSELRDNLAGVDYWADRSFGRSLGIDLKCREEDYPDLLIEFESNTVTQAPGWTIDPKKITDHVLYLMPSTEVLLPYPQLRAAATANLPAWVEKYPEQPNRTTTRGEYRTRWIAVPDHVVAEAIGFRISYCHHDATQAGPPVHGGRCPQCQQFPIGSQPTLDASVMTFACPRGHRWQAAA